MWLEILLVLFPVASLVNSYESDDDETYHNYRFHDDGKFDLLADLEGKPHRADDGEAPGNATMAPEDVEVVKGAIQKLLGNIDPPDHVAPTSPTRPPPLVQLLTPLVEHSGADGTAAPTASSGVTRSSYTQLLEKLIEYADSLQMTKNPPLRNIEGAIQKLLGNIDPPDHVAPTSSTRPPPQLLPRLVEHSGADGTAAPTASSGVTRSSYTQLIEKLIRARIGDGQLKTPARSTRAGPASPATAPGALRQRGRGGRRSRRRSTSTLAPTVTGSTVNTLCTHDAKVCATMCFDHEKYRISCPPTKYSVTQPEVDVSKLLDMLSSLVVDYDTNITEKFRQSLIKKGYVSCQTFPTTPTSTTSTTEPPALYDYEASNKTGAVISKCFVCGLDDEAIPMNAHCSDAFAGEFLPMTPVDASARGHLATYRKYCKFMDMVHWYVNGSDSRSMWGRWTGGCSVRWVDLSGVYTQRACRNRLRPVMGNHFVSKRMAKLEKSLRTVDNGCIISPMASLVPFARGVSLFARFHACVCTGNWCNRGARLASGSRGTWLLVVHLLLMVTRHS